MTLSKKLRARSTGIDVECDKKLTKAVGLFFIKKLLATLCERMDYVCNHVRTQYHLIGTCKMGEAVDDGVRVIGAKWLRVIDASVFPGHFSGNIMSRIYVVVEKGADLIKEDYGMVLVAADACNSRPNMCNTIVFNYMYIIFQWSFIQILRPKFSLDGIVFDV